VKKILAFLLTAALVLTFSTSVFAAEILYSGEGYKEGKDVKWTLDDNGSLRIYGNGPMMFATSAPWKQTYGAIRSVTIEEGVTSVGEMAFYGTDLKSISLPTTIKSIEHNAFNGLQLRSIIFPENLEKIGKKAFECTQLTSLNFPSKLKTIEERAFAECMSLSSVKFSENLESIGDHAFFYCDRITNIEFSEKSIFTIGEDAFSSCKLLESINIPGGATLSKGSFSSCDSLKVVILNEGITAIPQGTFTSCSDLKEITIPKSITLIDNYAFSGCSELKDVYYNGTREDWAKIQIGSYNEDLTKANIHFKEQTIEPAPVPQPEEDKDEIPVMINGKVLEFDQEPVIYEGRTLVPLRVIFTELGAEIVWDNDTQTVTATKGDTVIIMQINNVVYSVNGVEKLLDVPAQLVNARTMIPVRAVAESFGCSVEWIEETNTVKITS